MNSLNSLLIEGVLTENPCLQKTPNETAFCTFQFESHRFYKFEGVSVDEVSYFEVEVWGKLAKKANQELTQGRGIRVVGRIREHRWEDDNGEKRSAIKIIAEHLEFKPVLKTVKP